MKWLRRVAITMAIGCVVVLTSVFAIQRWSDGPVAFLQGGSFRTGAPSEEDQPDWEALLGSVDGTLAFELVGYGTSRTTGALVHDGELYIPCDRGYMWARLRGPFRLLLRTIHTLKTWHEDAVIDGRAVLRIDGTLIGGRLDRVVDATSVGALRGMLDARYTAELGPPPTEGPRDIWFFRFTPES